MTHEYNVTGMSCTHCLARVQKALEKHPEIAKVEVSLDPPRAKVTMKRHVPTGELDKLVSESGGYHISEG
jgi:copper chaperone CopZ